MQAVMHLRHASDLGSPDAPASPSGTAAASAAAAGASPASAPQGVSVDATDAAASGPGQGASSAARPAVTSRRAAAAAAAAAGAAAPRSAFVPLLLVVLAGLVWLGNQLWFIASDKSQLESALQAQEPGLNSALAVRKALDALAADTQRLADGGNPNARALVDELRRRGVTINPGNAGNAGTSRAPAAAAAPSR